MVGLKIVLPGMRLDNMRVCIKTFRVWMINDFFQEGHVWRNL